MPTSTMPTTTDSTAADSDPPLVYKTAGVIPFSAHGYWLVRARVRTQWALSDFSTERKRSDAHEWVTAQRAMREGGDAEAFAPESRLVHPDYRQDHVLYFCKVHRPPVPPEGVEMRFVQWKEHLGNGMPKNLHQRLRYDYEGCIRSTLGRLACKYGGEEASR